MKLKNLALATMLAAGVAFAPAANAASISETLGLSGYGKLFGDNFFQSSLTSDSSFLAGLQSVASTNSFSQIVDAFVGYANGTGAALTANSLTGSYVAGNSYSWLSILTFNSAANTIQFAGNTITASTGNNGSVTPVPGPEAGAGLGALAMGGLAFWINRRRKDAVAA
jgi:MYXO-CTERM domain-containing protein